MLAIGTCWVWATSTALDNEKARAQPGIVGWEYKVVAEPWGEQETQKALNELGAEGWELAGTTTHVSSSFNGSREQVGSTTRLLLKRPKQ